MADPEGTSQCLEGEQDENLEIGYGVEEINDDHLKCYRGKNSGERHYLKDARLLPCLHSFCGECLKIEIGRQVNVPQEALEDMFQSVTLSVGEVDRLNVDEAVPFTCPVDGCGESTGILIRGNHRIEWSRELRNSSLQNMVASVCLKKRLLEQKQTCDTCLARNVAVAICIDEGHSDLPLCQACLQIHQSAAHSTSTPNVIRRLDLSNRSVTATSLHRRAPFCHIHQNQRIRMYCPVHKTVVCLVCAVTGVRENGHDQCRDKFDVEVHPDHQYRQQVEEKIEKMETLQNEFENALRNTEMTKKSLDAYHTAVLREIRNRYETLWKKLEERQDKLITEVDNIYRFKQEELERHAELLRKVKTNIAKSLEWIREFTKAAIPAEFLSVKKKMEDRMNLLTCQYKPYMRGGPSKHPDVFLANDVIQYDINDEMTIEDAMGEVYSTPCLRNFGVLDGMPVRLACKDIFGTCLYKDLPKLEAVLLPHELSDQGDYVMRGIVCSVMLHPEHGIYTFFVDAQFQPGSYRLLISHPNPPAYFDYEKHGKIVKLKYSYEDGFSLA